MCGAALSPGRPDIDFLAPPPPGRTTLNPRSPTPPHRGPSSMTTLPPRLHALGGPEAARDALEDALFEVKRVIVGQDAMLERVLVALLAGGHVLLEGVPGLAKTLTVKTVADVMGGTFQRIQFTPDLVPSDLVGTRVLRPGGTFETELG